MSRLVVADASVAMKWLRFSSEAGVDEALDLIRQHQESAVILAAPSHMRIEVMNGLWSHRLSREDILGSATDLEDFQLMWIPTDSSLATQAVEIAVEHNLTVYDALYVAAALALDAELATSDRAIIASGACEMLPIGLG